ncbi:hypothetical protein Tco_0148496, partial [Tanacetum coccineum]
MKDMGFSKGEGLRQGILYDLMIFCNGDYVSAGIIKDALNEFSAVSGLFLNLNKSSMFFRSMNNVEKQRIVEVMQFQEGTLPTKYLG